MNLRNKSNKTAIVISPDLLGLVKNGGVGTACYELARHLRSLGVVTTCLFTGQISKREFEVAERFYGKDDIQLLSAQLHLDTAELNKSNTSGIWPPNDCIFLGALIRDYLQRNKYKYIFFQDYLGHGLPTFLSHRAGQISSDAKLFLYVHSHKEWIWEGNGHFANTLREYVNSQLEMYAISLSPNLICPSEHMRSHVQSLLRSDQNIQVIPYLYTGERKQGGPISTNLENLIFFGRLEPRKGLLVFLRALRELKRTGKYAYNKIQFIGKSVEFDGATSGSVISNLLGKEFDYQIISDYDSSQALKLLESSSRHSLVVCPYVHDNYPLAIMELLHNGIPFITTNAGGIPEMLPIEVQGKIIPPDHRRLAKALLEKQYISHQSTHFDETQREARLAFRNLLDDPDQSLTERGVAAARFEVTGVSVIVPYFNMSKSLEVCIDSLLSGQTVEIPLEIIVVDDCSAQDEHEKCREIVSKYSNAKLLRLDSNLGPGAARNRGAIDARFNLVLYFDADNIADNTLIQSSLNVMLHSGADIVTCWSRVVQAERYSKDGIKAPALSYFCPVGDLPSLMPLVNVLGDTVCLVRREILEEISWPQLYDSREDWEFLTLAVASGYKLCVNPTIQYTYVDNRNGLRSSKLQVDHAYGQRRIAKLVEPLLRKSPRSFFQSFLNFGIGQACFQYNDGSFESVYDSVSKLTFSEVNKLTSGQDGDFRTIQIKLFELALDICKSDEINEAISKAEKIAVVGNTPLAKMLYAMNKHFRNKCMYIVDKRYVDTTKPAYLNYVEAAHVKVDLWLYTSERSFAPMYDELKQNTGVHLNPFSILSYKLGLLT